MITSLSLLFALASRQLASCPLPAPASAVAPYVPSANDRREIAATTQTPAVQAIRGALDGAAGGTARSKSTRDALTGRDPSLLRDKFAIMSVEHGIMGGLWYDVYFEHHPSTLYTIWVYHEGGSSWELRSFEAMACSNAQMKFLHARYDQMLRSAPFI